MINVTVADLEKQDIELQGKFEVTIQGKIFRKETIVPKKVKDQIPQIAEKYSSESLDVIVVEHQLFFSIWIEQKIYDINKTTEEAQDEISSNQQIKKTVVRSYRGVSYEVEAPEHILQNSSQSDKKRKFRGQEY